MPRVLVTGVSGFIARHTVPEFMAGDWHVEGLHRQTAVAPPWPIRVHPCDLTGDPTSLRDALHEARPDVILHLAAMIPPDRVAAAWSWIESNGRATDQLLDAARTCTPVPRVVVVSSGAVYGSLPAGSPPFTEDSTPAPATAYGVSKMLVESLAMRAAAAWSLPVIRVRLFNVSGPGEPAHLAVGRFARRLVAIERGGDARLEVDDLSTERDYVDVRDAARGIFLAATRGQDHQVYNVCSGEAHRMSTVLDSLIALCERRQNIDVRCRATGADPIRSQRGSAARLTALTGWKPVRSLSVTLQAVMETCRDEAQRTAAGQSRPAGV